MKQVIFDTDIGIDDAMALLFLHYARDIDLIAIVTGFGNASIEDTTRNALCMKSLFDIHAPVYRGAQAPLAASLLQGYPDFVHGKNGLGDIDLPAVTGQQEPIAGAQAIVDLVQQNPQEVTIVAVGRMTNVANALTLCPELPELIDELIVMGGAFGFNGHRGNVSPVAEANVAGDPQAADIVFSSALPTTIVGLDVTQQVLMRRTYFEELRQTAGEAGEFIAQMSECYLAHQKRTNGRDACPVHDPSAVAYLLQPEIFQTRKVSVRVATEGVAMGQTIWSDPDKMYQTNAWQGISSCRICTGVDGQSLLDLYRETLVMAAN